MANCQPFRIKINGQLQAALDRAKKRIEAEGGKLVGDTRSGSFVGASPVGEIKGSYEMIGSTATVNITDRPWLAGCKTIQNKINEFFNG